MYELVFTSAETLLSFVFLFLLELLFMKMILQSFNGAKNFTTKVGWKKFANSILRITYARKGSLQKFCQRFLGFYPDVIEIFGGFQCFHFLTPNAFMHNQTGIKSPDIYEIKHSSGFRAIFISAQCFWAFHKIICKLAP